MSNRFTLALVLVINGFAQEAVPEKSKQISEAEVIQSLQKMMSTDKRTNLSNAALKHFLLKKQRLCW
jgi:ssDNA-specific exonuclease RecJ